MHTPRLCIDARLGSELSVQGLLVHDTLDQLMAAQGEESGSSWLENRRTVILSHPEQVFPGQLKRYNLKWKTSNWLGQFLAERPFVEKAQIDAFHRFRTLDSVTPLKNIWTLTTLVSGGKPTHRRLPNGAGDHYIVPSKKDAEELNNRGVDPVRVFSFRSAARRYLYFVPPGFETTQGILLFLWDPSVSSSTVEKLRSVMSSRYPRAQHRLIKLSSRTPFQPEEWVRMLKQTKIVFYLHQGAFDWPFLALESMALGLPTVFSDSHAALNECIPDSPFRLSRFLIDPLEEKELQKESKKNQIHIQAAMNPLLAAEQYQKLYSTIPQTPERREMPVCGAIPA